jgi:hypothetical protein
MKRRLSDHLCRLNLTAEEELEMATLNERLGPLLKKQKLLKKSELYAKYLKLWVDPNAVATSSRERGDNYLEDKFDDRLVEYVILYWVKRFKKERMLIPDQSKCIDDRKKTIVFEFEVGKSNMNGKWSKKKINDGESWSDYGEYEFRNVLGAKKKKFEKTESRARKEMRDANLIFLKRLEKIEKTTEDDIFDEVFCIMCARICFEWRFVT